MGEHVVDPGVSTSRASVLPLEDPGWSRVVESAPDSLPFHHPAWAGVLADTYRRRPLVLAVLDEAGVPVAGLPVLEAGTRPFTRRWVGLPFTDWCPPLTDGRMSHADLAPILAEAPRGAGVSRLEVRSAVEGAPFQVAVGVRHVLALSADVDSVFEQMTQRARRGVSRSAREGVRVARAASRDEMFEGFHALHVESRRRLGVPVQPRRFFDLLWERILEPELGFVLTAYADDTPVASAVFLAWNRQLVYKFSAHDYEQRRFRGVHAVVAEGIRWGCREGYERLDFGRTEPEQEGLAEFKRSWGAEELALEYSWFGDSPPATGRGRAAHAMAPVLRRSPPWVVRAVGRVAYRYMV